MWPFSSKLRSDREMFLSSTFRDLSYYRNLAADVLVKEGYKIVRSEDLDFARGSGDHKHDICLQRVDETHGFLLIIDWYAGQKYEGKDPDYRGLSITHAEAKRAFRKSGGWHCFASHEVITTYNLWKQNKTLSGFKHDPVEPQVFDLLDDIYNLGKWGPNAFDGPDDFKQKLRKYFRQLGGAFPGQIELLRV